MDTIIQIAELIGAAVGASWLTHLLTIRSRVRTEKAGADKAEQEAKSDQIENIEKMVEKAYKPIIEDLSERVQKLQEKVDELEEKAEGLEEENRQLRAILREVSPESIPSRRGENGKSAPRGENGRFVKVANDGE